MIPSHFIPIIGEIAIAFSDLDREIIYSIWHLLECDAQLGSAVTGNINSPTTRIKILRDLASVKLTDEAEIDKLNKLLMAVDSSMNQRNRLFHDIPYWFSPSKGEVGYFRHNIMLKSKPPTVVSEQWLHELLVCIRVQSGIFQRFRGFSIIEGQPWFEAEIPFPNRPL